MSFIVAIATDLVAVTILAYVLYFRRHRRRDLLLSYVALNVGVLAVTIALSSVEVGIGLGIGLFGILSIIRLRSDQITQQEIAYYFTALVLGLLTGLRPTPEWLSPVLAALILLVIFVADSGLIGGRRRHQEIMMDRAYTDESELRAALAGLLHATDVRFEVRELDLVRETTLVDVRYRAQPQPSRTSGKVRPLAAMPPAEPSAIGSEGTGHQDHRGVLA